MDPRVESLTGDRGAFIRRSLREICREWWGRREKLRERSHKTKQDHIWTLASGEESKEDGVAVGLGRSELETVLQRGQKLEVYANQGQRSPPFSFQESPASSLLCSFQESPASSLPFSIQETPASSLPSSIQETPSIQPTIQHPGDPQNPAYHPASRRPQHPAYHSASKRPQHPAYCPASRRPPASSLLSSIQETLFVQSPC
ncbi:hypothetical protein LEMLEM_LOCUS13538 [Lemmus lemmus]